MDDKCKKTAIEKATTNNCSQIEQLQSKIQALEDFNNELNDENKAVIRRAEAAESDWQITEAELDTAKEMLKKYGTHDHICRVRHAIDEGCCCGFKQALESEAQDNEV